ncbi:MAG: MobC family plasmid mobilization relaxosome protein [Hyphomicrobium sp.]|nr:MobC family plasmid mobilization relaxosome protein [Hyphomicrobium sp.]
MSSKKPKTSVVAVRVSIEQREAIEKAAVTAGASVSGFIAVTLAEALSRKPTPSRASAAPPNEMPPTQAAGVSLSDPAALAELKRIGVNINQLAHAANAGYPPNIAALIENVAQLFAALGDRDAFGRRIEEFKARMTPLSGPAKIPASPPSPPPVTPTPAPTASRLPSGLASLIGEPVTARPARTLPTRAVATTRESPPPRLPPRPMPQPTMKDDRRAPQHSQARNQLQSRPELRPARPAEGDGGTSRLGFFRKLWDG